MGSAKNSVPKSILVALSCLTVFTTMVFWLNWWIYKDEPTGLGQMFDNKLQDFSVHWFSQHRADKRISILAIDDESIKKYGWPFPRREYPLLIEKLNRLGASTIAFDMLFLDPDDRSSSDDRRFVDAVKKAGNVILSGHVAAESSKDGTKTYRFRPPFGDIPSVSAYVSNVTVDDAMDSDGHIRRVYLFNNDVTYDGAAGTECRDCPGLPIPMLSVAAYAHYTGKPLKDLYESIKDSNFRWVQTVIPSKFEKSPGREKDRKIVYDAIYPRISCADVLEDKLSAEEKERIRGGLIFVGSTAEGAYDHYPTPFAKSSPGAEHHANVLDNMLHDNFMKEVSAGWSYLALVVFIWLPVIMFRVSPYINAAVTGVLFLGWLSGGMALMANGYQVAVYLPLVCLAVSFSFVTIIRVVVEGREKKWIKNTFGQYLSPKVVEVLVKDPDKLRLGGEKRDMTVFFLDIAHFTSISEKMEPEKLTQFLNKYLSAQTDIILKNDGVVDKYIGDCIMAFWNAPLDLPDHRYMGCLSAVECIEAVRNLNKELKEGEIPEKPAVRIGLNAGNMVVGNMGSTTRFSYTVIGDEVNLASRLEGANKYFGSSIMASESVFLGARDHLEGRKLGKIRVVGKNIPIQVYEPLGKKGALSTAMMGMLAAYMEGYECYHKRDFEGALKHFNGALQAVPDDKVAKFYIRQAEEMIKNPPPQDWDGVFNLTSK